MKLLKYLFFCFLFFCKGENWACPSLFFSKEELASIKARFPESNLSLFQLEEIFLSSLAYVDENRWSLWVNNQLICSDNPYAMEGLQVEIVSRERVRFAWSSSEIPHLLYFTLHPGETFSLKNQKKVDGK